jgi:hypothetical protein
MKKNYRIKCGVAVFAIVVVLTGMMGCAYKWAMAPTRYWGYIGLWRWEWDTSGRQWAKDRFGPVILQWDGLDDPAWNCAQDRGNRSQLEVFWQARERYCRMRLLCFLAWAGFAMMLAVWSRRNNAGRVSHERKTRPWADRPRRALIAAAVSIPLFQGMYQWATLPERHIVCPPRAKAIAFYQMHRLSSAIEADAGRSTWMADCDKSGMKWAKDNYGPVLLQYNFIGNDKWWARPWTEGIREDGRWIWRQFETGYRLSALLAVLWISFIGMLVLCVKRSAGVRMN